MAKVKAFFSSPVVHITAYYIVVGLVVFGLLRTFPRLETAFTFERLRSLGAQSFDLSSQEILTTGVGREPLEAALDALIATIGALLLLIPVAWVYMFTKQQKGYDESVVHTVLILPVPITGLVIVLQDSIALAFSLAGIVAAVRFRNTLEDTKDAVYIFLTIGTALAAGSQALGIAAVASVAFNYLVLFMHQQQIGNIYADQLKRTPRMRIGDVLAGAGTPLAGTGKLTIGDASMLIALTPDSLKGIAERKARLRAQAETATKGKKFNGFLIVLSDGHEEALDAISSVLQRNTERFKLAEITPSVDGNSTIEYLLTVAKDVPPPELIAALRSRAQKHIVAAEYRDFKTRKSTEV